MSIDTVSPAKGSPIPPPAPRSGAQHANDLRDLLRAMEAMRAGDFSVRLSREREGAMARICVLFNEIVAANQNMAHQLERIGKSVGEQGRTRQRVKFGVSTAAWGEMESSINSLIDDLLWPTTEVTRVISAVAQGDLLQTVRPGEGGLAFEGVMSRVAPGVKSRF